MLSLKYIRRINAVWLGFGLISLIASHAERLGIHNPLEDVVRRSSW